MTETLLLRPSPDAEDRFDSVVLGTDGQIVEQSIGADQHTIEAAANGRKVIGLIPGGEVLLTTVRLPPMPAAKLRQGVAYALEDQLIDDLEIMLAQTDLDIAAHYAALAGEASGSFFERVREEYARAVAAVLEIKECHELLDDERTQQRALALRNPYVDPMHLMQVDLLRRWRAKGAQDRELFEALLASINGIAQGLQTTG
jgi:hypothetical protein